MSGTRASSGGPGEAHIPQGEAHIPGRGPSYTHGGTPVTPTEVHLSHPRRYLPSMAGGATYPAWQEGYIPSMVHRVAYTQPGTQGGIYPAW